MLRVQRFNAARLKVQCFAFKGSMLRVQVPNFSSALQISNLSTKFVLQGSPQRGDVRRTEGSFQIFKLQVLNFRFPSSKSQTLNPQSIHKICSSGFSQTGRYPKDRGVSPKFQSSRFRYRIQNCKTTISFNIYYKVLHFETNIEIII